MTIVGFTLVAICSVLQPCNFPKTSYPFLLHFSDVGPRYISADYQFEDLYAPVFTPLEGVSGLFFYPGVFTSNTSLTKAWIAVFDEADWYNTFDVTIGDYTPPVLTYIASVDTGSVDQLLPAPYACMSEACVYVTLNTYSKQHITYFYDRNDFTRPVYDLNPVAYYNFHHFVVEPSRFSY